MRSALIAAMALAAGFAAGATAAPQLRLNITTVGPMRIDPGRNATVQVYAKNIGDGGLHVSDVFGGMAASNRRTSSGSR